MEALTGIAIILVLFLAGFILWAIVREAAG